MTAGKSPLAIHGGPRSFTRDPGDLFKWPIVTPEDEEAVLAVLRAGSMSKNELTREFEREWAEWLGCRYALAYPNGTEALRAAMWAAGVGAGDEIIAPSLTYWASAAPALSLGAAVHFAECLPETLCLDPADIEHRIGPRTRAIIAVHYFGYPCEMDPILAIARKHKLPVIEDASHSQGGLYKGKKCGTFGKVSAMSLMSGKSISVGEGGMLVTDDRAIYERCLAYGFYERTAPWIEDPASRPEITDEDLLPYAGLPLGGYKHRMNQMCAALGRVQLKYYDGRMAEIQRAMNRFWDLLEGVPGLRAHRPPAASGSTMGGWYAPRGLYRAEELGGLPCARFCEAVTAEISGFRVLPGCNKPLHLHPLFHTADIFRMGRPTVLSFGQRDVRQGAGSLPVTEKMAEMSYSVPWFKHDRPEVIEEYAAAYRKVAKHAHLLL
ncbi:MAG: DegT/DnrJ/EryC1/StrS family aminotransferase [Planctomycetota bacterium]